MTQDDPNYFQIQQNFRSLSKIVLFFCKIDYITQLVLKGRNFVRKFLKNNLYRILSVSIRSSERREAG